MLESIARACSPRVMVHGTSAAVFDAAGLTRVLGRAPEIAREVRGLAAAQGVAVRTALAGTCTAAWLLAHARNGETIVAPGGEASALAPLPLSILKTLPDPFLMPFSGSTGAGRRRPRTRSGHYRLAPGPQQEGPAPPGVGTGRAEARPSVRKLPQQEGPASAGLDAGAGILPDTDALLAILVRWGLFTLGDLARLSRAEIRTRLGEPGVRLHQAALGEDAVPFAPADVAPAFVERLELEWPVEGLEPLSFVLARLCETLSARLEQADRGAVVVTTRLALVTRETHTRVLNLPAPMRDARVLRTLVLLDLESHPPAAGIDAVEIELAVTSGRIEQGSLLARTLPSPEDLSTLLARLRALAGETRVGAPALADTHDERQVRSSNFEPRPSNDDHMSNGEPRLAPNLGGSIRRFRLPVAASVTVERGTPVHLRPCARGLAGGRIVAAAGPWRSSGRWWTADTSWDRDAWDVEVESGVCYRLARDRATGRWEVEGAGD